MKSKIIQPNPFTPKSGLEPRVFMGREYEISCFRELLKKTERNYFDHFIILGEWGVGKTTLLKEFRNVAQSEGILTSFIRIEGYPTEAKVEDGIKNLVRRIPRGLPTNLSKLKSYTRQIEGLGIHFFGAGLSMSRSVDICSSILLEDSLVNLWKDLKDETRLIVILLDDVQNFDTISEIFTTLRNVLSSDEIIKKTKYLFCLSCTMDMWSQFLKRHHPIGRYFTPRLKLGRLNQEKTRESIIAMLSGTGVAFDNRIISNIYEYTGGHPYELQVLCSYLYEHQIEGRVTEKVWEKSLLDALMEVGEIVFDAMYEQASSKERQVLHLMALSNKTIGRRELALCQQAKSLNLTDDTISMCLTRLLRKGLIQKPGKSRFTLLDRFFREYLIMVKK